MWNSYFTICEASKFEQCWRYSRWLKQTGFVSGYPGTKKTIKCISFTFYTLIINIILIGGFYTNEINLYELISTNKLTTCGKQLTIHNIPDCVAFESQKKLTEEETNVWQGDYQNLKTRAG